MANPDNPFGDLERMFEQMQENVRDAARWWEQEPIRSELPGTQTMSVDLADTEDELVLTADLPGFETEDIDVQVTDQRLRVSAEWSETERAEKPGEYVRCERRQTSVERSISLPASVKTDDISATYSNGVLTVRMPKQEREELGTTVEIQ